MKITCKQLGKRYVRNWIFKNLDHTIESGLIYAIRGRNGTGKSTLLKIISGYLSPSEGQISWHDNEINIPRSELYSQLTYSAPYMDLIDAFSLTEMIEHHIKFKPLISGISPSDFCKVCLLEAHKNKFIADFSSGMKQRVKLALALLSDVNLILLDEPGNTLDSDGKQWFQDLLSHYKAERTIVIASNLEEDLQQCSLGLDIEDYK